MARKIYCRHRIVCYIVLHSSLDLRISAQSRRRSSSFSFLIARKSKLENKVIQTIDGLKTGAPYVANVVAMASEM